MPHGSLPMNRNTGPGIALMTPLGRAPIRYAKAAGINVAYQILGDGPIDIVYEPGLLNLVEATWEEPAIESTRLVAPIRATPPHWPGRQPLTAAPTHP